MVINRCRTFTRTQRNHKEVQNNNKIIPTRPGAVISPSIHTHAQTSAGLQSTLSFLWIKSVCRHGVPYPQRSSAAPPLGLPLLLHLLLLTEWYSPPPSNSRPSPAHPESPPGGADIQTVIYSLTFMSRTAATVYHKTLWDKLFGRTGYINKTVLLCLLIKYELFYVQDMTHIRGDTFCAKAPNREPRFFSTVHLTFTKITLRFI